MYLNVTFVHKDTEIFLRRLLNFMEQQGELTIVERLEWIYMYMYCLFNETCTCTYCYFGLVNTWLHVWMRVCVTRQHARRQIS